MLFIICYRFNYDIVICYEYIVKGKLEEALEIINDIENILLSIGTNDKFLKSIRIALNHITFSMKGHVLKLYGLDTVVRKKYNLRILITCTYCVFHFAVHYVRHRSQHTPPKITLIITYFRIYISKTHYHTNLSSLCP